MELALTIVADIRGEIVRWVTESMHIECEHSRIKYESFLKWWLDYGVKDAKTVSDSLLDWRFADLLRRYLTNSGGIFYGAIPTYTTL